MNSKLTNAVNLIGNASQVIIAGSILAEIYFKIRERMKTTLPDPNPDDDGDLSPSSPQTPLAA